MMSKVPYTVDVDEYICTALDQIRTMHKTRDYSGLMAAVERIQFHASKMEDALYRQSDKLRALKSISKDDEISAVDKLVKMKEKLDE